MQYQTLRSVSDTHIYVICRDGEFYELPDEVRHRGPWQGLRRGQVCDLKPEFWLDLMNDGYALVRTEAAVLQPEI